MTRNRRLIIAISIGVLVALNVIRWWPATIDSTVVSQGAEGGFSMDEFRVNVPPEVGIGTPARDIFHPIIAIVKKAKVMVVAPPPAPTKSPEEIALELAQAEFAKIRCAGVSMRNERFQAYLIYSGESFLISRGDRVGDRFVVEKIVQDGVFLHDPDTDVGGMIFVSGK